MDWASWFLLAIGVIWLLFNIKNVYLLTIYSFKENGIFFTSGLILLVLILILGLILAFAAPQYGWIVQRALILYIVAFIIYRIIFGVRDREG